MKSGSVYEFDSPNKSLYDTTKTFLIENQLNCRKFEFKSVKSRLRVSTKPFFNLTQAFQKNLSLLFMLYTVCKSVPFGNGMRQFENDFSKKDPYRNPTKPAK